MAFVGLRSISTMYSNRPTFLLVLVPHLLSFLFTSCHVKYLGNTLCKWRWLLPKGDVEEPVLTDVVS